MFENVDWAATGAFWGGIGSLAGGIALWATFLKARESVNDWREQELLKENRKLAIEILAAFEDGKDAIASIRNPFSRGGEVADVARRLREAAETENVFMDERDRAKHMKRMTVHIRLEHFNDTWVRISKLLPLARAVFGVEVKELLRQVLVARTKIFAAAEMFRHDLAPENVEKYERIIWPMETEEENDPIIPSLNKAQEELERILTKFVRLQTPE